MASIYTHQDRNIRKTWFLMVGFFLVIAGIGYFFSYVYNNPSIFYFAIGLSIVMNIGSYWFSDRIVVAIAGAKQISKNEYPDFWNITENLCITAGLPMPRLYVIADPAPNAFATGRDAKHAVVAATTGLIDILDRSELEGVIAHELSHIGNKDMLVSTVAVVLVGIVTLLADMFLRMTRFGGDRDRKVHPAVFLIAIGLSILSPLIAKLMQLAISRRREFLADASGVLLTRYPEGLASALKKISAYGQPLRRANHATAHLYIATPFNSGGKTASFLTKLFMTHPPVEDRIAALLGYDDRYNLK